MIRWSYKTVHYELKKEGILGSAFLDESEIELSLNQYGKAGWELVSLLETMDGLIAVFKQPLELDMRSLAASHVAPVLRRPAGVLQEDPPEPAVPPQTRPVPIRRSKPAEATLLDDFEVEDEKPVAKDQSENDSVDIGSIRIE